MEERREAASLELGAFFSPLVLIDGQRPRWIYRDTPADENQSGWAFIEGSESDEWLNEEGHCLLAHLGHALDRWPEIRNVISDGRAKSSWEWRSDPPGYIEITSWKRADSR